MNSSVICKSVTCSVTHNVLVSVIGAPNLKKQRFVVEAWRILYILWCKHFKNTFRIERNDVYVLAIRSGTLARTEHRTGWAHSNQTIKRIHPTMTSYSHESFRPFGFHSVAHLTVFFCPVALTHQRRRWSCAYLKEFVLLRLPALQNRHCFEIVSSS